MIVEGIQTQNEAFYERLQTQQQEFKRQQVAEQHCLEHADREAAQLRTCPPELKVEPPEFYEGEAAEVDLWLRRMTYYFAQV
jgi:hypothetical protein